MFLNDDSPAHQISKAVEASWWRVRGRSRTSGKFMPDIEEERAKTIRTTGLGVDLSLNMSSLNGHNPSNSILSISYPYLSEFLTCISCADTVLRESCPGSRQRGRTM